MVALHHHVRRIGAQMFARRSKAHQLISLDHICRFPNVRCPGGRHRPQLVHIQGPEPQPAPAHVRGRRLLAVLCERRPDAVQERRQPDRDMCRSGQRRLQCNVLRAKYGIELMVAPSIEKLEDEPECPFYF
jgi:hypothetical protein